MGTQILAVGGVRMFRYALGTLLLLAGTALLVAKGLVWLDLEPKLLRALQGGSLPGVCRRLYNVFEDALPPKPDDIPRIKAQLLDCGALGAAMTGTGSALLRFDPFGEESAVEAISNLYGGGCKAFHYDAGQSLDGGSSYEIKQCAGGKDNENRRG